MSDHTNVTQDTDLPILIVDDNPHYSKLLTQILTAGFGLKNIKVVDSTLKAYDLIKASPEVFSLLFVDYNFPDGANGGDLLTQLHGDRLLDGKVAFLITSEPSCENQSQATRAGALGVVAKPFDRVELGKQLEQALRRLKGNDTEHF